MSGHLLTLMVILERHFAYADESSFDWQDKVRSCTSCHLSSTNALGLGEGDINIGLNSSGKDDTDLLPLVRTDIIVWSFDNFRPAARVDFAWGTLWQVLVSLMPELSISKKLTGS